MRVGGDSRCSDGAAGDRKPRTIAELIYSAGAEERSLIFQVCGLRYAAVPSIFFRLSATSPQMQVVPRSALEYLSKDT
jgi:hypothetical protein